ncbi:MAG: ATP-binding protein [Nitriliruptorales bacterium]|nr:ATP-binding protein [Nitriliruptorales bacterium]
MTTPDPPVDAGGRAALDLLPEAVVILDDELRIVHHNDRAVALLDLPADSAGKLLSDVVTLQDDAGNECTATFIPDSAVADRMAERLLRLVMVDGRLRPVAVSARFEASRTVLTFRNAGRRERLDRARSDLVATVSHEIRSPLTSVKGFTRTMLSKWERFSDEQKRTMLETINLDADRVTRLLKELLDVSRIDAGRVELHREMVDLGVIADSVAEKARHRPEGNGRAISVEIDDDLPGVYADPDKLEQVLTNLVENALKYAPDSPVRLQVVRAGDEVHASVADEGPGISTDQLRRIFEKFGRGRENRRSGTGLGLYISRGLVTAHGGRMWAESIEGEGATFHVVLPAGVPDELQA